MTKILAIDDKKDNLVSLSATLKSLIPGCTVITAMSGLEGIEKAKTESPDTIVLDIKMPGMDGYETCKRLKKNKETGHIPVIMVSAIMTETRGLVKGLDTGADAYLAKPIDEHVLAAQIKTTLRMKKAEDVLRRQKKVLEDSVLKRTAELTSSNAQLRREIEERKQTEGSLIKSEEKLSQAIQGNSTPTFIIDNNHTITHWNNACEKLTGLSEATMVATKKQWLIYYDKERPVLADFIVDGVPGEVIDRYYKRKHQKSILVEGAYEAEQFFPNFGEKGKWIFFTASPLRDHDGNIMGAIETFQNITERKSTEAQLRQAQRMESIGTLAGGIAHDFNNVLFPILGHADMLLADIPEDSPSRDSLNKIYTSALRARDLVRQILTFASQDTNELILMEMQPVIKEALKLIRSTIPTTIDIKQDIRSDCGTIKADPTQIHQIVMNLATNAYHAMEDTGGELKVSLKEVNLRDDEVITPDMTPGVYACLIIADTGTGMDKNVTEKIFDPFFTTKGTGKGTGMGLSVVHGIVNSAGGAIHVYSEPGKSTKFNVYLPVIKSSLEEQKPQVAKLMQGGTERILLVDDEILIAKMLQQILERLGYHVTSLNSSIDALEVFRANSDKFDMVITDMGMPNMSGDKLSAELIKIRPDIPILICTGFSEKMTEEKIASLNIKGFVLKPVVMKDLAGKIREMLDEN
ncbi:MAG: response regulator [Desulfobacterales bacterium]|nr:response regulator [Desulfobacterales bacterium]